MKITRDISGADIFTWYRYHFACKQLFKVVQMAVYCLHGSWFDKTFNSKNCSHFFNPLIENANFLPKPFKHPILVTCHLPK